jgi:UDP-2-acetamido-2,6-beta-L-arabino-hexul-4-ose reductase
MTDEKLTIGITGADGLIGTHTRALFHVDSRFRVVAAGRSLFADSHEMQDFLSRVDVVIHLAGMNRGDEALIANTNVDLVHRLIAAAEAVGRTPHLIFASSTHIDRNTLYGASKRESADLLDAWARRNDSRFTNVILPNVYGEGGKPFYNSVISTFCHQLALGEEPTIHVNTEMTLMHASQAGQIFRDTILSHTTGEVRPQGAQISVSDVLYRLKRLLEQYAQNIIPDLRDAMDLDLFNTLRHELFKVRPLVELKLHGDDRGTLFETVRTHHGGQSFVSRTKPGITRGNHFHFRKLERFLVLEGRAVIRLRKLFTNEVKEFAVNGTKPQYIDIPTLHTHSITNVGEIDLVTQFWSHEIYDPNSPDTYAESVLI